MKFKIAIAYLRASTDHQEYSVQDQLAYITEWAKKNNCKIVKVYCDDGISGAYAAKRPGFLAMIEDVTTGLSGAEAVLVWDSYRFARNMVEFLTYKQMIRQHGVSVIAVTNRLLRMRMHSFTLTPSTEPVASCISGSCQRQQARHPIQGCRPS